ncbi:hypothetical protein BX666DRAFT_1974626 [Dichotomocladium elegans]|nr:hypothetical protein BX666DRAFT_1974626 [Dichotomocladium elegans]
MSSLAELINNVKSKTASNAFAQKNLGIKRKKATASPKEVKKIKKTSTAESTKEEGPKVVVFDGSVLDKKPLLDSAKSKKAFMSSNVFKTEQLEEEQKPKTDKEKVEEEENQRHDIELNQLLATSKLLEEYQLEEMSGKERRKHMMDKLETLGAKKQGNAKMPLAMHMGMKAKEREREAKRLQEAKDLGLYDKSLKHLYASKVEKKKPRNRDSGITNGVGYMKGGTLHIGKHELRRIERQGSKKRSTGANRKRR